MLNGFIGRALPGELDGTLDPRDYGFEVTKVEPMSPEDEHRAIAARYRYARALSGVGLPKLDEKFLRDQPYDPEPARRLAEKHDALPDPYKCRLGAARLEIDRGVFCPTLTKVSPFMYGHLPSARGKRTLDAFTGSGVFAINAAHEGGTVVAYDNSPVAVSCAQKNAHNNGVTDRLEVRRGTLHEVVSPSEQFDLIIANPPLIPGEPNNYMEQALFDDGLAATKELIAALPDLLATQGVCYLATSDVIDRKGCEFDIAGFCKDNGLTIQTEAQLHLRYESYRLHKIELPSLRTWMRALFHKTVTIPGC